jgi:hypothetical protein
MEVSLTSSDVHFDGALGASLRNVTRKSISWD